eukprot:6185334-Pleurochrysis_carterae.AAC.3
MGRAGTTSRECPKNRTKWTCRRDRRKEYGTPAQSHRRSRRTKRVAGNRMAMKAKIEEHTRRIIEDGALNEEDAEASLSTQIAISRK